MNLPYRNPYVELNMFNAPLPIKTLFSMSNIFDYSKKYNFIKISKHNYTIRTNCSIAKYIREYGNEECISLKIKKL